MGKRNHVKDHYHFPLRCSNRSSVSGEWGRCFSLTNVSMTDSGRLLSFQVRSTQDNKVTTVNYTLHVTPAVDGEPLTCCAVVFSCVMTIVC